MFPLERFFGVTLVDHMGWDSYSSPFAFIVLQGQFLPSPPFLGCFPPL